MANPGEHPAYFGGFGRHCWSSHGTARTTAQDLQRALPHPSLPNCGSPTDTTHRCFNPGSPADGFVVRPVGWSFSTSDEASSEPAESPGSQRNEECRRWADRGRGTRRLRYKSCRPSASRPPGSYFGGPREFGRQKARETGAGTATVQRIKKELCAVEAAA